MKRILLLALLALSSNAWAGPKGTVKISVYRTEIVLINKNYEWLTTLLCEETLPIEVVTGSKDLEFKRSETCKFNEGGVRYHADTYHLAAITDYVAPGTPKRTALTFSSNIFVHDDFFNPLPFVTPNGQSFFTKDLNLKNAMMALLAEQSVTCSIEGRPEPIKTFSAQQLGQPNTPTQPGQPDQENCQANNPLGISAVFEYDIN